MKQENFFEDVYEVVKLIPKGRATSYGAIAQYLGLKSSARMVGWAMNSAHDRDDVPAHRVVNRDGLLTGRNHFATPMRMEKLLKKEGIRVKNNQIFDFQKVFWDPMQELM
jgi:methylated-DNA-protein-cysteine methyltransferase-like protein